MREPYPIFAAGAPVAAAFIAAHPAHELRVLGWFGRARPLVEVLTTGSRSGDSFERLERTGELIDAAGGQRGRTFGAMLDREFYALVMAGDARPLLDCIETAVDDLLAHRIELVVTDAWQGYSPAHDLTHLMARLAAARASERSGRPVRVMEYAAAPRQLAPLKAESEEVLAIALRDQEVAAKRAAVEAYPDIAQETAEILALEGEGCMELERFFKPAPLGSLLRPEPEPPYYERVGDARVRSGLYRQALRHAHVAAIGRALIASMAADDLARLESAV